MSESYNSRVFELARLGQEEKREELDEALKHPLLNDEDRTRVEVIYASNLATNLEQYAEEVATATPNNRVSRRDIVIWATHLYTRASLNRVRARLLAEGLPSRNY